MPKDWRYISHELNNKLFEKFIDIMGAENYITVSGIMTQDKTRFSIFVSPQGRDNVLANIDTLKAMAGE